MSSLTMPFRNKALGALLGLAVLCVACGKADVGEDTSPSLSQASIAQSGPQTGSTSTTDLPTVPTTTTSSSSRPPTPGQHFDGKPITRKPIPVQPGETVTVVVDGWTSNSVVEVGLDNRHQHLLGEPKADAEGVVRFTFELPEATPGVHILTFDSTEILKGKGVRLLYPGLPKVGDGYSAYVCCFKPHEGYQEVTVESGNDQFGMMEWYKTGVDPEGGVLVTTLVLRSAVGDPTMTIRLTNLVTGEVVEEQVAVRPDDGTIGFTVRQVALDLRNEAGEAPGLVSDIQDSLETAYNALNIPGITSELADAALANGLMALDHPDFEDLDEETQSLLESLPEVDPEESASVYNVRRDSNRSLAVSHIFQAAELIENGPDSGTWSVDFANDEIDLLAAAGRGLAVLAILATEETDDRDDRLEPARDGLTAGDAHRAQRQPTDAIAAYMSVVNLLD